MINTEVFCFEVNGPCEGAYPFWVALNQTFIDLQQPSAGLYAVRLLAGNKLSSMKIIVN
jgi:hypothetical protein